jgi:cytochrome c1
MKKLLFILLWLPGFVWAAPSNTPLDQVTVDPSDQASLQRGAQLYMNYCMGCHSLQYQRYNRFARDAGVPEELVMEHLVFDPEIGIGDLMTIPMSSAAAEDWFGGVAPPDLSLITRSTSNNYVYTYLRSFYSDDGRPFGTNNPVLANTSMPNVLWQLQGLQEAVFDEAGEVVGFELVEPGSMTPEEFDMAMADLVNFMAYVAEPYKLDRERIGKWVLLYLALAFVVFYLLKKEYWKDVH